MLRKIIFTMAFASLAATGASATHLSDLQGSVLVNNQAVAAEIELAPGDRVRVVSGAVKVVYNNGSTIHVTPGQTVVVLKTPPEAPATSAGASEGAEAGALAMGGSTVGIGYIAGGAAVAGGAGLAIALSEHSGKSGSSGLPASSPSGCGFPGLGHPKSC